MNFEYKITTGPTTEPVSLSEAKIQCRVESEFTEDDAFLTTAIVAAREYFESVSDRFLINQTVELALPGFPAIRKIELVGGVVSGITSVKYRDEDDAEQTLDSSKYLLNEYAQPNFAELVSGEQWPDTYSRSEAVKVLYQTGYANASAVPQSIKASILLMVSDLYANREATTEAGKASVLQRAYSSLVSINKTFARW